MDKLLLSASDDNAWLDVLGDKAKYIKNSLLSKTYEEVSIELLNFHGYDNAYGIEEAFNDNTPVTPLPAPPPLSVYKLFYKKLVDEVEAFPLFR